MITLQHTDGRTLRLPASQLAATCLELTGGGMTEKQTANAMLLADTLRTDGKAKVGRVTITYTPEEVAPCATQS